MFIYIIKKDKHQLKPFCDQFDFHAFVVLHDDPNRQQTYLAYRIEHQIFHRNRQRSLQKN